MELKAPSRCLRIPDEAVSLLLKEAGGPQVYDHRPLTRAQFGSTSG